MTDNGGNKIINKVWPTKLFPLGKPVSSRHQLLRLGSSLNVVAVGLLSKLFVQLNRFTVINQEAFLRVAQDHYAKRSRPLLTITNHSSCLDDPVLWGALLPWSWQINSARHRWTAAADDICFTKSWHTWFFALGQTFPVERGGGIHQPAIDFAIQLLKEKRFLHCFPQGKVADEPDVDNVDLARQNDHRLLTLSHRDDVGQRSYHFKWGLARLILETLDNGQGVDSIDLLPFYHIGMNHVLPSIEPYIPRIMKKVTIYVRKEGSIVFDKDFLDWVFQNQGIKSIAGKGAADSLESKRIALCRYLEDEVKRLKLEAMKKHWGVD